MTRSERQNNSNGFSGCRDANGELEKQTPRVFQTIESCKGLWPALRVIKKYLRKDTLLLILGPSGVGKYEIAKYIHYNSHRADGPIIEVNCASIPENRFEAEMFGWVKGSFTNAYRSRKGYFAMAHRGTLFLDEVGELSPFCQAKLLTAIENKIIWPLGANQPLKVDCRIIAATNTDINDRYKKGLIREDFFWRLWRVPITIQALKNRKADIPLLINHFLKLYSGKELNLISRIEPAALKLLLYYPWPGNIRQLESTIERAVSECVNNVITVKLIEPWLIELDKNSYDLKSETVVFQKSIIENIMAITKNNTETAKWLGMPLSTLKSQIKTLEIHTPLKRKSILDALSSD